MGAMQIAYCGLAIIKDSSPLFYPMWELTYSNGYNLNLPNNQNESLSSTLKAMKLKPMLI